MTVLNHSLRILQRPIISRAMVRSFAVDTSTSSAFDRDLKLKQRNNATRAHNAWKDGEDVVDYNYFRKEMAYRLVDR
jgi:hypothetical protein